MKIAFFLTQTQRKLQELGDQYLDCSDLATRYVNSTQDAAKLWNELMARLEQPVERLDIYGTFQPLLRHWLLHIGAGKNGHGTLVVLHEAHYVVEEGPKEVVFFDRWVETGYYFL